MLNNLLLPFFCKMGSPSPVNVGGDIRTKSVIMDAAVLTTGAGGGGGGGGGYCTCCACRTLVITATKSSAVIGLAVGPAESADPSA